MFTRKIYDKPLNNIFPKDIINIINEYVDDIICVKCKKSLYLFYNMDQECHIDPDYEDIFKDMDRLFTDIWYCKNCLYHYTVHIECLKLETNKYNDMTMEYEYDIVRYEKIKDYIKNNVNFSYFIGHDNHCLNDDITYKEEIKCKNFEDEIKIYHFYVGHKKMIYAPPLNLTGDCGGECHYWKCRNCEEILSYTDK
jgi:hypothetical protein